MQSGIIIGNNMAQGWMGVVSRNKLDVKVTKKPKAVQAVPGQKEALTLGQRRSMQTRGHHICHPRAALPAPAGTFQGSHCLQAKP